MPFDGNRWDLKKMISEKEILSQVRRSFPGMIAGLENRPHDTSRNFKINGYQGTFGLISSVTNPFCDSCNRIRLTANGHIKNCLFSTNETDLLTPFRAGESIVKLIEQSIGSKKLLRAGMDSIEKMTDANNHSGNRSMISIGG
jgi:cyclic pyranopterin phosphate synthase